MTTNYKENLTDIKAFIFDVDGVLTDGKLLITETGELLRSMTVSYTHLTLPTKLAV